MTDILKKHSEIQKWILKGQELLKAYEVVLGSLNHKLPKLPKAPKIDVPERVVRPSTKGSPVARSRKKKRGSLTAGVMAAIDSISSKKFTFRDVVDALTKSKLKVQTPTINAVIKRQIQKKAVKVIKRGKGRRLTVYGK